MTAGSIGKIGFVVVATALMCGCANSGFDLSTASVTPPEKTAKADPVCASLASQINTLKGDGTIDKLEKAADGKGAKVSVKRTALQKQAELNKAYGQFQTRCGPPVSNQVAAQQPAQSPAPAQAPTTTNN
jgi:outer membrane murein-binding lipoprotein Lpp